MALLRTDRLVLRPFTEADVDDVFAFAAEEAWSRYLDPVVPYPYVRADAEDYVGRCLVAMDKHPFAIERDGRVIGSLEIRPTSDRPVAELGWSLGTEHWGQGLMTEAVRAALDHAFRDLGMLRCFARADLRNVGSWRVMEKVGMTREALLRQHRVDRRGELFDELWYAILALEWPPTRRPR